MVKAVGKQQADAYLATMIETEKKTEAMFAAMARPGSDIGKMVSGNQAQLGKTLHDLEARLSAHSPAECEVPAFPLCQVVPQGTPGSVAVVYPNPDFYDRSLPPGEAQSLCVSVSTGPRSQEHFLYPTIVKIWNSLDWDAIAQVK